MQTTDTPVSGQREVKRHPASPEAPPAPAPASAATLDLPMQTMSGYQLLTTAEVAAILRVSAASVRELRRSGRLPAHPDFPTKLLFRRRDVLAFIKGE